jgi:hypothetical protein
MQIKKTVVYFEFLDFSSVMGTAYNSADQVNKLRISNLINFDVTRWGPYVQFRWYQLGTTARINLLKSYSVTRTVNICNIMMYLISQPILKFATKLEMYSIVSSKSPH